MPVLKEGAMTAPSISTEMIPTTFSAGRRNPVDQLGLVGPQDKTEQSVLPGSDTKEVGTDPAGPVGPDVTVDQIQQLEGPVGQYITRRPVGLDGMLSMCDSDQPVADGPVGQSFILGPVGPRRMFSQCKPNKPVAVGPVGQSFTPGPVGPCGIVSNCKWMDLIAYSPVGSTVIPDPVEQTESPIQIDFMKIVTTDGPASLGNTPPSSDSGIHSLGEQWENMSISTVDTETEQTVGPTNCSQKGRRGSDTRVPPKTEEDEDIICPWMDCLLKGESDESSSSVIQNYIKDPQYNENMDFNSDREPTSDDSSWENYEPCSVDFGIISKEGALAVPRPKFETQITDVTICREQNSSVSSGTDGGNSDIGVLADFSADEEESQVEQFSGCQIPGCQCEGRIEYMEWDSDDMTDTDDSEWEDPDERENRLYVERYNFDLIEGMTPLTYTPPPRKNRCRRYEDRVKYGPEIQESTCRTSELGFQTDEESPNSEPTVQPGMVADEDIPSGRDKKDNHGRRRWAGSDADISSDERSDLFDRLVTESVTAWAGSDTDFPSGKIYNFSADR